MLARAWSDGLNSKASSEETTKMYSISFNIKNVNKHTLYVRCGEYLAVIPD